MDKMLPHQHLSVSEMKKKDNSESCSELTNKYLVGSENYYFTIHLPSLVACSETCLKH